MSNFNRRQKRELGETVKKICDELAVLYRAIQWKPIEMRDLARLKNIRTFNKDEFEQIFTDASEAVDNFCATLSDKCFEAKDQILEIEKGEDDDGKGTKELLVEISEKAELFGQQLSKETFEAHFQEVRKEHMDFLNKQVDLRLKQVKNGIVRIVKDIKKVVDLEFEAESEPEKINGALTYGYVGILSPVKEYLSYLEKGMGDADFEETKKDFEPYFQFARDEKSIFKVKIENEALERDIAAVVNDETEADDVKPHCIKILETVRALPAKYKE